MREGLCLHSFIRVIYKASLCSSLTRCVAQGQGIASTISPSLKPIRNSCVCALEGVRHKDEGMPLLIPIPKTCRNSLSLGLGRCAAQGREMAYICYYQSAP
eukprot:1158039-Pelagomonas_calceolata.AAC.11